MMTARPGTALRELLSGPNNMALLAAQPFVNSDWPAVRRLTQMIEHCRVIDELGTPFKLGAHEYVDVFGFDLMGEACRLTIDRPVWLQCDGLLTASMWVGDHRTVSISFCLAAVRGNLTAYVGGIQGRRHPDALAQNRALTKAAHGARPNDLTFDLFRALLPTLGVTNLKCVANTNRYQKTRRALLTIGSDDNVSLNYDELWLGRGGTMGADGFFIVPIEALERNYADIPPKKRGMYRQRYALLRQLEAKAKAAFQSPLPISRHG